MTAYVKALPSKKKKQTQNCISFDSIPDWHAGCHDLKGSISMTWKAWNNGILMGHSGLESHADIH